jgi:hypothetical protein
MYLSVKEINTIHSIGAILFLALALSLSLIIFVCIGSFLDDLPLVLMTHAYAVRRGARRLFTMP